MVPENAFREKWCLDQTNARRIFPVDGGPHKAFFRDPFKLLDCVLAIRHGEILDFQDGFEFPEVPAEVGMIVQESLCGSCEIGEGEKGVFRIGSCGDIEAVIGEVSDFLVQLSHFGFQPQAVKGGEPFGACGHEDAQTHKPWPPRPEGFPELPEEEGDQKAGEEGGGCCGKKDVQRGVQITHEETEPVIKHEGSEINHQTQKRKPQNKKAENKPQTLNSLRSPHTLCHLV